MTKLSNEIKAAEEEKTVIADELEKFKNTYAKYVIDDKDKIKDSVSNPYVPTKKEIMHQKRSNFLNKVKKAIGL